MSLTEFLFRIIPAFKDFIKKFILNFLIFFITIFVYLWFWVSDNIFFYNLSYSVISSIYIIISYNTYSISNVRKKVKDVIFGLLIILTLFIIVTYIITTLESFKMLEKSFDIVYYKYFLSFCIIYYIITEYILSFNNDLIVNQVKRQIENKEEKQEKDKKEVENLYSDL